MKPVSALRDSLTHTVLVGIRSWDGGRSSGGGLPLFCFASDNLCNSACPWMNFLQSGFECFYVITFI